MKLNPVKYIKSLLRTIKTGYYVNSVNHGKLKEKTILLESKNGKDLAGNIFRLLQVLVRDEFSDFKVFLAVQKNSEAVIRAMTGRYGINHFRMVYCESFPYYRLLGTAKYLVEDTSFPAKFIKRGDQVYLNTWHGTPWKMMGRDEESGAYAIGNVQKNFLCADYLLYPSRYMQEIMFSAYMLEGLFSGKVLYEGYPRNSVFFNREQEEKVRREINPEGKQAVVYMPTWRGQMTADNTLMEEAAACYFDLLDDLLDDSQIFFVKFHLFAAKTFPFEDYRHIRPFPSGYEPYEVLNAADVLVTDYSSVLFDFANTGKKIILFPYDFDDYIGARGLYSSLDSMPFPKVYTAQELAAELKRKKEYDDTEFRTKYCPYDSPGAAERLAEAVFRKVPERLAEAEFRKIPEREGTVKNETAQPKRILVFSSGLDQNGLTASLLNLMQFADRTNIRYYFTFFQSSMKNAPQRIGLIPEGIGFLPINGTVTDHTPMELIAFKLFYKFKIDLPPVYYFIRRLYAREYRKHFCGLAFDGVIHFTGYSKEITTMLSTAPCERVIFVHSDMKREIATRGNQHLPTLRHAYSEYDKVIAISDGVRKSLSGLCAPEKITVLENAHDEEGVARKATLKLVIDPDTVMNLSEEKLRGILADDNLTRFINVGRFSPEKGQKKLMEAFCRYHEQFPETVLIIIGGNGIFYDEIQQYAASLPCADAIILIRALSNPFPVVKCCQLFLLSSDYEALGLVLLEAETLGVPAITTDIPGPGDFMKKYNGFTVDNSVEGLYQGMLAFHEGRVHPLGISFREYNTAIADRFNHLFDEAAIEVCNGAQT